VPATPAIPAMRGREKHLGELGHERITFWNPSENESWYFDDAFFDIKDGSGREDMDSAYTLYGDHLEKLPDHIEVIIESGEVLWQDPGKGQKPTRPDRSFVDAFAQWAKNQAVRTVVATLEVPITLNDEELQRLKSQLQDLGAVRIDGLAENGAPKVRTPRP